MKEYNQYFRKQSRGPKAKGKALPPLGSFRKFVLSKLHLKMEIFLRYIYQMIVIGFMKSNKHYSF